MYNSRMKLYRLSATITVSSQLVVKDLDELKKTKMKNVIKSRNTKQPAKSSEPKTRISGIYGSTTMELTGMTSQDTMASNKNNGREWGKQ